MPVPLLGACLCDSQNRKGFTPIDRCGVISFVPLLVLYKTECMSIRILPSQPLVFGVDSPAVRAPPQKTVQRRNDLLCCSDDGNCFCPSLLYDEVCVDCCTVCCFS